VGGLNSGGRGFYALDITDAAAPKGLWEFCSDANWCPNDPAGNSHSDPDLGFSYGNPVIGRRDQRRQVGGRRNSGLNNVIPATAKAISTYSTPSPARYCTRSAPAWAIPPRPRV